MAKWLPPLWMKVWQNGKCLIKPRFYNAWRKLAVYDTDMPKTTIRSQNKMEAAAIMDGYSSTDFTKIFTSHLAALPGWTGYINHRTTYDSQWQKNILSP
jgi:uncharacterized protein YbcC (UPF0753/DUF2309 family)